MSTTRSLEARRLQPELMDQPSLPPDDHHRALTGLRRVNWISRAGWPVWNALRRLAEEISDRPLRVLDLASGGGDLAVWLAGMGWKNRLPLEVTGCDISDRAVDFARCHAARVGHGNVAFQQLDVLHGDLPTGFDVVMCSLFLHHLSEPDAAATLRRMSEAAGRLVLVDDLQRCTLGYTAAWLGCRLLTRSHVVHVDGPLSVAGAFSLDEIRRLSDQAGLRDASVTTHWPWRFLLSWSKPR
ncbi:MAG: methyltransferase domain-containing protein [Pirellulales bacterium]